MLKTPHDKTIRNLSRFALGAVCVAVLGFVGMKMYPIIHGPDIQLNTVQNGATLATPLVSLSGFAKYTRTLVVNGDELAMSPNGSFKDDVLLSPGYNVITVKASDQFGKTQTKNYSIVLNQDSSGAFTANIPPFSPNL